jgi:hypothetical protein
MADHRATHQAIERQFTHQPPQGQEDVQDHEQVRAGARELAHRWADLLPAGEERNLAIRHLRYAVMWGNAALAMARS